MVGSLSLAVQKLKEKLEFGEPGGCCGTEILKSSPLASGNILKSSPLSNGNPQLVPLVGTSIFRSASSALWSPREWTHVSGILVGVHSEGSFGYEMLMRPREHVEVS